MSSTETSAASTAETTAGAATAGAAAPEEATDIATASSPFAPITESERAERIARVGEWAGSLAEQPERGALTFHVAGQSAGSVGSVYRASGHRIVVDEPAALAGDGLAPNPVEYALTALLSCQVVTYRVWAANLGITVDTIEASADGDLDARGFLGVDDSVRPGFTGIRLTVRVSGPESEERYLELRRAVEAHCPVQDLFANPTPITTRLEVD